MCSSDLGVARRGLGAVGKSIEKQIGQAMARQMLSQRHAAGEDQARAVDTAPFGFTPQVGGGNFAVVLEPQDTIVDLPEQAHPHIEDGRRDLVDRIERTEDEA